jgi:hypothetical protein
VRAQAQQRTTNRQAEPASALSFQSLQLFQGLRKQ